MRIFLISIAILFSVIQVSGQIYSDILRYSQQRPGGTARVVGVGGSFGAMGGDYGGVSINPSALGNYWLSEFTISPGATFTNANTTLLDGPSTNEFDAKVNLANAAIVFASSPMSSNWETSSLTFGYNRLANFNAQFTFEGKTEGSIVGRYLEKANGLSPNELDDFEIGLAYEVGAIYEPDDQNIYLADFNPYTTQVNKEQTVDRKGGINEFVVGWGGNYKRKLNVGATLGVPFINFEESKIYQERDLNDEIETFDALTFSENLRTTGIGIKMSVGATYIINKSLRVGAAYHTRSFMALKDSFNTVSYYAYTFDGEQDAFDSASPQGIFDYGVRTPRKAVGSLGYLFRKSKIAGFVNLDVEYINHSKGSFNLTRSNQSSPADAENEVILNDLVNLELSNSINIRIGSELAMGKWRIRGGAALNQSPFEADNGSFETNISTGLGFRSDNFYIDLAGRAISNTENYIPYLMDNSANDQLVNVDINKLELIMTAGFVF